MRIDEIKYAMKNIWSRKTRSWLTILSILIGVTAIFAIVSFGLGIIKYVNVLSEEAGTDKLYIQPKGIGAPGLDDNFFISKEDIDFVAKIKGVDELTGLYFRVAEIKHKKHIRYGFAASLQLDHIELINELFTVEVGEGRQLKKGELSKVVLGYNYQFDKKIFEKGLKLGDKVQIQGHDFEIVGFYEEVGNAQDDSNIYLTEDAFEMLYPEVENRYSVVMLRSQKGTDPQELSEKIEEKLRKFKNQEKGKEDFFVMTFADALETFGQIFNILNGVLVLIAFMSLVVAAINTTNTMYTAVLERTKEIGVMKAIGARNGDIMFIFLLESGFLGTLGGILGVILGYLIASAGGSFAASAGYSFLKPIFPWYLILACILFAFFAGALSGLLPAYQASQLKPVDALRYE